MAKSVMDVTKPYQFIGFGAMDVTKPYEFIGLRRQILRPVRGYFVFLVPAAER